jgi:hypothetical protein
MTKINSKWANAPPNGGRLEEGMRMLLKIGFACVASSISLFGQQGLASRLPAPGDGPLENHADRPRVFPNYAQRLTEQELMLHPDVLVVALHAQVPGEAINRVVAINEAQWGKFMWRPSDDIDTDTAKTQRTVVQVIPATHRMEVHMPLHTKTGETIATLVCVWTFKDEEEAPELMRKSQAIRDEIAPKVGNIAQLLGKP